MTLKEYVEKYYSSVYDGIELYGDYENVNQVLFYDYSHVSDKLTEINYTPFDYGNDINSDKYYGGVITKDIAEYIYENYENHNVNERFFKFCDNSGLNSSIKMKMVTLMRRYRYKWHALYESMLLDADYNPLDNVNETYTESITRTPDLTYTDTNSNIYGEKEKDDTNKYGAKSTDASTVHGKQHAETSIEYGKTNESMQETIGKRDDKKVTSYGELETDKVNTRSVYPFDDNTHKNPQYNDDGSDTTLEHEDTETNSIGDQMNTSTKATTKHTDTNSSNVDSYSDSNNVNESEHTDNLKSIEKKHSDSFNGLKTESGKEETSIEIHRHGNIGVTKSTTLIDDYRKIHYFDLVKIMGNDIVNEIMDLNFES